MSKAMVSVSEPQDTAPVTLSSSSQIALFVTIGSQYFLHINLQTFQRSHKNALLAISLYEWFVFQTNSSQSMSS